MHNETNPSAMTVRGTEDGLAASDNFAFGSVGMLMLDDPRERSLLWMFDKVYSRGQ
jgi:hypothetical protein